MTYTPMICKMREYSLYINKCEPLKKQLAWYAGQQRRQEEAGKSKYFTRKIFLVSAPKEASRNPPENKTN